MQTEIIIDPSERITTIKYVPESYDAFPPAAAAWMDGRVIECNRDREAVAQVLLLFPFVSGQFSPARGCGVDVASSLRELFYPRTINLEGVEFKPVRIPSGTRTAMLCDGSYRSAALLSARATDLHFRLSESAYTTSIGPRNVVVASNFGLFARQDGQLLSLLPALAAGLLFAEDLGIARFVLPIHDLTSGETELFIRLAALLAAVNITLDAPFLGAEFTALSEFLPQVSGLEIFFSERHEHIASPDDLPDYWLARLLLSQAAGDVQATIAASDKLRALSGRGFSFSARERSLFASLAKDPHSERANPTQSIQ
ncbi:hypothetical protein [Microvirga soli]|uniref:hypothetical protein n=1 Tax=Microvirga soli TaxID=1854496 RepID=UPI00191E6037|nr:hypothetical protein [Microvirga soli]